MVKQHKLYTCQECGASHPKWQGQCDACGAWNTLLEEVSYDSAFKKSNKSSETLEFSDLLTEHPTFPRYASSFDEFDRVCGGGLVPGATLLIGGDPGIGKSTLLLQVLAQLAKTHPCAYVSGEESEHQIQMRAHRLGLGNSPLMIATTTELQKILSIFNQKPLPKVLVVDSIQTVYDTTLDSSPGTVGQVRSCAHQLISQAKKHNVTLLLVGHVTKEGLVAGPRVLEHMVDAVLYFEGDHNHHFRLLRAVKNRFGATNEIGVFEMVELGLQEVRNPSAVFLSQRKEPISGTIVYAGMEGTRPLLLELQALVTPSVLGMPRRAVLGWDPQRLSMIIAVLEKRCGLQFGNRDVYLNVSGGFKISETAADLPIACVLASALLDQPLPNHLMAVGEISLTGEIRAVSHLETRLKEAVKLGFEKAIIPNMKQKPDGNIALMPVDYLSQALNILSLKRRKTEARDE